jgi:Amt family ammonium transporter
MSRIRWPVILALVATVVLLRIGLIWADRVDTPGSILNLAIAFLFPVGLTIVAWSALPPDQSDAAAGLATLALGLGLIGYIALGFGLQFGGAALISDNPELQNLSQLFSAVRGDEGARWGIFGLEGFFLSDGASTQTALRLFTSQLPLVAAVVLMVMLGVPRETPIAAVLFSGLFVAAITYPLAGHWVVGGGWLANLGNTLNLGHGVIDFAGSGTVFVLGGATVLGAAILFGQRQSGGAGGSANETTSISMPPTRYPVFVGLGALLALAGWLAVGLANPLFAERGAVLNWPLILLNGLAGSAAGTATAQLYSLFTTGRFDPLMGPRGALAGLVAISAGAPFVPVWAALVIGAVAGLLLPLAVFVVERVVRLQDNTAAISSYLLPGFWGLIAVSLFASGRWGKGWNGFTSASGQGVSGMIVAPGFLSDAGQLAAQFWGGVALFALGFLVPWGGLGILVRISQKRQSRREQDSQAIESAGDTESQYALDQGAASPAPAGDVKRTASVGPLE